MPSRQSRIPQGGPKYRYVLEHEGVQFRTDWFDTLYELETAEIAVADTRGGWDSRWCEKAGNGEIEDAAFADDFGEIEPPNDE